MTCKTGPQTYAWDLTYDGAETIPGSRVDAGDPAQGVPAPAGTYTATFTSAGKSVTVPVVVRPDPRLPALLPAAVALTPAQLFGVPVTVVAPAATPADVQTRLALELRDDISTLTRTVTRLRLVQKQLALRKELLADRADAKELLAASAELSAKLAAVEGKLHNPKAKIVYDIFSARGGSMLYSQFAWVLANVSDGPGVPTKAMREQAAACKKALGELTTEFDTLMGAGLTSLNDKAKALGVPGVYGPAGR